ncbi:hypothetical protein [Thermomonas brevis]
MNVDDASSPETGAGGQWGLAILGDASTPETGRIAGCARHRERAAATLRANYPALPNPIAG